MSGTNGLSTLAKFWSPYIHVAHGWRDRCSAPSKLYLFIWQTWSAGGPENDTRRRCYGSIQILPSKKRKRIRLSFVCLEIDPFMLDHKKTKLSSWISQQTTKHVLLNLIYYLSGIDSKTSNERCNIARRPAGLGRMARKHRGPMSHMIFSCGDLELGWSETGNWGRGTKRKEMNEGFLKVPGNERSLWLRLSCITYDTVSPSPTNADFMHQQLTPNM